MLQLRDTNVLKGLAIMLMLIHHLFWKQNGLYDDIHLIGDKYLVNQIGILAKVCVAIFVFLSGYGLTVQADKKGGTGRLRDFYLRRFKKLYLNYWFVWLIFVPISIFAFGRTFEKAFPEYTTFHVVLDVFGLHNWIFPSKPYSYNATWWFYSCIIALYLLFPYLYKVMKQSPLILTLGSIAVSFIPLNILSVNYYIFIFVLGMLMARQKITPSYTWTWAVLLLLLGLLCGERLFNKYPLMMDGLITLSLVMVYSSIKWPDKLLSAMSFIGKHSMNIFLFHTFIFSHWFKEFIYASRNPIIIFCLLLAICVAISIVLEQLKRFTIYKL